ncbi:MAG: type I-C CRISPR-associated protein Cas7/Csd2 [Candidatus Zipacnadales bacterium]
MSNNKHPEAIVDRRYDFVLLFDVTDGNPNGDPDAGNLPRLDFQTMQGFVTDGCLKRKIRDYICVRQASEDGPLPGYAIYVQIQGILEREHYRAYKFLGLSEDEARANKDVDKTEQARRWMCQNFFDVRAFGAVMSLKVNCGQVRGPVQLTFARSIDPIVPLEITIVRKAVATEDEASKQTDKHGYVTGTMGRKHTVPYGLYRGHGFVNPFLAKDTGFTYADLSVLFEALTRMFELDRSASRGLMTTRGLYVFEHESALGNAPAHQLFDRLRIEPLGPERPPRSFDDYRDHIVLEDQNLPQGVRLYQLPAQHNELFAL